MKKFVLMSLTLCAFGLVNAQNYTITPSKSKSWTIDPGVQAEMSIYVKNTSLSPITLSYRIIGNTMPSGWFSSICDNNVCWDPLPKNTTNFAPIQPNEQVYLKFQVLANNIKGTGDLAVKLYELGDSSKPDTLKYNVNVLWNSSIASVAKGGLSVAPNPANNMVNVNGVASKTPYTICDLNGKILLKGTLNPNDQSINISVLSSGVYVLNMQSAGAQKQAQRLVVQ